MQVYWISGRSANSRNRIFVAEGDVLRTEAADPAKLSDPTLIIYNAMRVCARRSIVSNGVHTDAIHEGFAAGRSFAESLAGWLHEPDPPNYTPRIAGYVDLEADEAWLAILKASPFDSRAQRTPLLPLRLRRAGLRLRHHYVRLRWRPAACVFWSSLPVAPRRCVHARLWEALNPEHRIALAVRRIAADGAVETEIINRYEAV